HAGEMPSSRWPSTKRASKSMQTELARRNGHGSFRSLGAFSEGQATEGESGLTQSGSSEPAASTSPPPFSALEHVFIFTTGGKRSVWESPIAERKFREWVGRDLSLVRQS